MVGMFLAELLLAFRRFQTEVNWDVKCIISCLL